MKNFNDIKIGTRLSLFVSASVIFIITVLGIYIYVYQKSKIISDTDQTMTEQVNDLYNLVQLQINERQDQIASAINVAVEVFNSKGKLNFDLNKTIKLEVTNQISLEKISVEIPLLYLDKELIYNNTVIVDKITELTRAKATIFQKIDGGYLRISTSVLKTDGNRAINTFIPNDSPVVKAIENGEDYSGRAFVVNDWYLTYYRPLKSTVKLLG